ncbi:MAG TPA: tyrosine-type recombinase/integrase [Verrucomicrobiae bacterium]|nr:tyrosine-type recombinase/integrase [Verrucomicrobiae bacterium]
MNGQKSSQPTVNQPVFHRVAENLYRLESSGGYYALLKRGGKQFRRSLKTKDRKLADRRLAELRAKVGGLQISADANLTFIGAATMWLDADKHALSASTNLRRELYVKGLLPFFEGIPIRNITSAHCHRWVQERGATLASETFVHELDVLKSILNLALERGMLLENPARHIKRPKVVSKRIVVPSVDQFGWLINAIRVSDGRTDSQDKAKDGADLVEFLAYSGARIGEVTGGCYAKTKRALLWNDVDFEKGTLFLPGTKTEAAPRTIPMSDRLRQLLLRLKAEKKPQIGDPIFPSKSARKCLQTACKKLGLPMFTHHDFRHFFATTCIESGVDIPTVSRWLGHKDGGALAMKRYGHLRQEHSLAMIKRVSFDKLANVRPTTQTAPQEPAPPSDERRAVANAKAKYKYPWWASEIPLEVFWGQFNEVIQIVPVEKLLEVAKLAMGREVFKSELPDRQALLDELSARIPAEILNKVLAKTPAKCGELQT